MNLEVLLEQAKEKALESTCRVPMVAFLLRNGKPIAYGVNKKGFRGASIHAEIDCLRKIRFQKRRGKNTTMVVIRHLRDGSMANAKPCANCVEVLKNMGVKNVAWTTNKQSFELSRIDNLENDFLSRRANQTETGLVQFQGKGS
tara:strand:+ start:14812 stop:15243 length:432 start_codon:yes stop_codon:yes gene_type:complete